MEREGTGDGDGEGELVGGNGGELRSINATCSDQTGVTRSFDASRSPGS